MCGSREQGPSNHKKTLLYKKSYFLWLFFLGRRWNRIKISPQAHQFHPEIWSKTLLKQIWKFEPSSWNCSPWSVKNRNHIIPRKTRPNSDIMDFILYKYNRFTCIYRNSPILYAMTHRLWGLRRPLCHTDFIKTMFSVY